MVDCAVCSMSNATTRLCRKCARDPYNADWSSSASREELGAEIDIGSNERLLARAALQDLQWRPPRRSTGLQIKIFDLIARGRRESVPYRDRRGRRRGTRIRWRVLRVADVARLAGCHVNYVIRVRRMYLEGKLPLPSLHAMSANQ